MDVLTYALFRDWLREHRDGVVGSSYSQTINPLANYLTAKTGKPYWVSRDEYQEMMADEENVTLPEWACSFARNLDRSFCYRRQDVPGWCALEILASLAPGDEGGVVLLLRDDPRYDGGRM
jgi:hypothetical protein